MKKLLVMVFAVVVANVFAADVIKLDSEKVQLGKISENVVVVERDAFTPEKVKLVYKKDVEVMVCKEMIWHDYPIDYHHPGFVNPNQECILWEKEIVTKKFSLRLNFKKAVELALFDKERFALDLVNTKASVVKGSDYQIKSIKFPVKSLKFIAE